MGSPYAGSGWRERYGDQEVSQFRGAKLMAERWGLSRQHLEEFALRSHQRALAAQVAGEFHDEIVPFGEIRTDEGPRPETTLRRWRPCPRSSPAAR